MHVASGAGRCSGLKFPHPVSECSDRDAPPTPVSSAENLVHVLWSTESEPGSTPCNGTTRKKVWQDLVGMIRAADADLAAYKAHDVKAQWPSFQPHPANADYCHICGNRRGNHGTASDHCPPAVYSPPAPLAADPSTLYAGIFTSPSSRDIIATAPIPMRITCPMPTCGELHVDEGWPGADKPHHTHVCQKCGHTWRPAVVATVGVRFLPGFKNEE
jgi:hypothetical protein